MIHFSPKKLTLEETTVAAHVRGNFDKEGNALSVIVIFLTTTAVVHSALHPRAVRPTLAELNAINAVPKLPGEHFPAWLERAAAPWVEKTYGVSVVAAPATFTKAEAPTSKSAPVKVV